MARLAKNQTFRRYEAYVTGKLWQGCDGYTSYNFERKPTEAEVRDKAGDFESVERIRIFEIATTRKEMTL